MEDHELFNVAAKIFVPKAISLALAAAKAAIKQTPMVLETKIGDLESALKRHLDKVEKWSSEVTFKDISKPKSINRVYVELDIDFTPQNLRLENEHEKRISLRSVLNEANEHLILLGQPGAGKTTSVKKICQLIMHEVDFLPEIKFPLWIEFRAIRFQKESLISAIANELGLRIIVKPDAKLSEAEIENYSSRSVISYLDSLDAIILLDGFDEIPSFKDRDSVFHTIRQMSLQLTRTRIIITSRTVEFRYSIENTKRLEICPLTPTQIKEFAYSWLEDEQSAGEFLGQIMKSPYADSAMRPLTLAHLCAIFERLGQIPPKPKTIYKKIISLLLEEWDEQRSVRRNSIYEGFELERRIEFLARLAYELTTSYGIFVFDKRQLQNAYKKICEDFNLDQAKMYAVLREVEAHSGLFLQNGNESYIFAHKSLQEYLAADHLVRLPKIPQQRKTLQIIPDELAISISISSSPSEYFVELVLSRLIAMNMDANFLRTFINRILLEKPEFNKSRLVIFALLALYTLYRNNGHGMDGQLSLFYDHVDLTGQFQQFISNVMKRNSDFELLETHGVFQTLLDENKRKIFVFRLLRPNKIGNELPNILYAHQDFLSEEVLEKLLR